MKNTTSLLFFFLFLSNFSFAQDKDFVFNKDGFTDFVVTECDGKSQSELYKKALDWVAVTYKNPKEVIKAQIENDYIRIEGSDKNILCTKVLGIFNCNLSTYQIEISFKDGKYKFDLIEFKQFIEGSQYVVARWSDFDLKSTEYYYNKKGEIKNMYKDYESTIPSHFNNLNLSLKDFILNDNIPSKNNDW